MKRRSHLEWSPGALGPLLDAEPDWRDGALCAETDPELFFPEGGEAGKLAADQARGVCIACPVRAQCLEYAMDAREEGIWAGLTERARHREAARSPRRTPAEIFAGTDDRYRRRRSIRLTAWEIEAAEAARGELTDDRIEKYLGRAAA